MKIQVIALSLTIVTALLLPMVAMLVRFAVKWSRVETKLDNVVQQLKVITADRDRLDAAVNTRLRWLEEHLWKEEKGKNRW